MKLQDALRYTLSITFYIWQLFGSGGVVETSLNCTFIIIIIILYVMFKFICSPHLKLEI